MNNRNISAEEMYADDLTWREREVLILLSERLTNREIAERLHLAESTVKDYVGKIISKLFVKNRRQAVERAKSLGLLEDERGIASSPPASLPADPTPFVGRRNELEAIMQHLGETRLLTLTGPGGIGKTRLALRTAKEKAGEFKQGCFFVSLAPVSSVEHLIQAIAEGLKFPLATLEDPLQQLKRYLRGRHLLLVMDNFEHLLEGTSVISEILIAAPGVKVLATSRERLNIQSETTFIVRGMEHPKQMELDDPLTYDAISLFVQSARKVRPGYGPVSGELEQIVEICRTVQGMPLAIELAAAWLHILTVDEITDELKTGFDILASEVRDLPERHRSMHNVFDHSWSLLDKTEQKILVHLSVFRGGFTRHAAQQVARASLQQLAGFVNKSFLNHDPVTGRLEFHELLRQFTQEKLVQTLESSVSAQQEHAAYYGEFMEQSWTNLQGSRQILALSEIKADIENVRAAWRYYLERKNVPQMRKFINSFKEVYWIEGWNHAGMELFAEAVSALKGEEDQESKNLYALAMAYQGYFMSWWGLSDQGYELAVESVGILKELNDPEALAFAYESLALNAYCLNKFIEEVTGKDKLLQIATELGSSWMLGWALFEASMVALRNEDYVKAKQLAEASLSHNEEIGNEIRSTLSLLAVGHASYSLGEHEEANNCYLRILEISQKTGFLWGIEKSSKYLGKVALSRNRIATAEGYLTQSLRIANEIGLERDKPNLLYEYACLLVAQGKSEQAAELLALILQHPVSHQIRLGEGRIKDSAKVLLVQLEDQLSPEAYAAAMEYGQAVEMDEIIGELVGQGR